MKRNIIFGVALLLSLSLILGACAPKPASEPVGEVAIDADEFDDEGDEDEGEAGPVTLRIAVLPIIDTIPLFVARDEGLFEEFGLDVEFIPVSSAPELSQMVASGQADGMVTDGLTVAFFDKEEIQIQIVRYGQTPSANTGHFFILAANGSGISTPEQLKGVEIGISEGTIIEYITDRLLQKQGFLANEIKTIAVPKIPDRMALLASGELQAAVLPDPLASLAVQQGATIILDDSQTPEYGASVYVFTTEMINEQPEAIGSFVEAIDIAVRFLAEDPDEYIPVLTDNKLIPPPLIENYTIPPFPTGIYSEAEWQDTLAWAQQKGLLLVDIPYAEAVNTSFLP
ncbi:MAG: ABC transporter substrate-binding protein [Anaerolineae bacterium]|jgi:NitT/TauT family transport system substrate-binding protein|nr:ABC transporter substrate-binding protein [Anaerolineae bacterium]MBT3711720.1 ABC transporter substrate-binding protein [Anaerolineae bacterium]MBT4309831.1 ABC transporter substrate-binding protein [Anaerolineae bacterium]MBT4460272.1 ABC transporter substrate-binding protein [Anaerolineae bacterium]MBT6060056.1 ABC transporter substrate-binding protein [Anaerolineae bacterium]